MSARVKDGGDLRMGAIGGDRLGEHPPAGPRGQIAVDIDVAERAVAEQDRALQAQPPAERQAHRRRLQRGIDAGRLAAGLLADPLGQVVAAMIGGQHHHIVDIVAVELPEELAERAVERHHLDAHLAAAGAERVSDIIGRRQADGEQVGRLGRGRDASRRAGPTASARIWVSKSGEARKRAAVAGGAGEAAGADRLSPGPAPRRRGCAIRTSPASGIGSRAWASAVGDPALAALTAAGAATPAWLTKARPFHHQRWSGVWPPIMIAARSLPATATTRLRGSARCIRSPRVGTRKCTAETV